jgi:hypothetical protein
MLNRPKVKVQLLHAGHRVSVLGRWTENPRFEGTDDAGFDSITQAVQNGEVGDLPSGVDGDIHHYVSLHPMRKHRQVGRGAGRVGGQGNLDRA